MQRHPSGFFPFCVTIALLFASGLTSHAAKSKHAKPARPVPAPNALDGKQFLGALTETGIRKGRQEMLEFKNGRLISSNCARHGFTEIPYFCTRRADGSLRFVVDSSPTKTGILHCDGVIYGTRLDGVMTWAESQDKVHTYGVHALALQPAGIAGK